MEIGRMEVFDGSHGDWETLGAYLFSPTDDTFYISVGSNVMFDNKLVLVYPSK